jgi:hypothetical protein
MGIFSESYLLILDETTGFCDEIAARKQATLLFMKRLLTWLFVLGVFLSPAQAALIHWELITGGGTDIGVGSNGKVWLLGKNGWLEDKPIFRRDGDLWTQIAGRAMSIAVDTNGLAWVANRHGELFRHDGNTWSLLPGKAMDIGIGAEGSVWIIGYKSWNSFDTAPENAEIFRYNSPSNLWEKVDGNGVRIAVAPDGRPWIVNRDGQIFRRKTNDLTAGVDQWELMPGSGRDIGIGADGSVWLVGGGDWLSNKALFVWSGANWSPVGGSGIRISAGPDGFPWMVNVDGDIFRGRYSSITATDVVGVEGGNAIFEVRVSPVHTEEVRVDFATVAGSARATNDFEVVTGTLVFPPGTTNRTVTVPLLPDNVVEGVETFGLRLSNPMNALIRTTQATGTIQDLATLSIADAGAIEGSWLSFLITRSGSSSSAVSLTAFTSASTASSGVDYLAVTNAIQFAPGETSKVLEVFSILDSLAEPTETFTVILADVVGAAVAKAQATGSITNSSGVLNPADMLGVSHSIRSMIIKTVNGQVYTVEYTDQLQPTPIWKRSLSFAGTGSTFTVSLEDDSIVERYYRVRVGL